MGAPLTGANYTPFVKTFGALVALLLLAATAHAHHSAAIFDRESVIEVEGVITEVAWVNPHVKLKMRGAVPGGTEHVWTSSRTRSAS